MRFLAILALLAAIYYLAVRPKTTPETTPAAPSTPSASSTPARSTNAIKQPIDRTKDVLDAAKRRSQEGF